MTRRPEQINVLVVGAGPAGLAAACRASELGKQVLVVDDNPRPGGQIWRTSISKSPSAEAANWFARIRNSRVQLLNGARVIDQSDEQSLRVETQSGVTDLSYDKLILATGARERFLPFPGWTLPNVFGAGGLQALVKSGMSVTDKRIVVAGSGPLLLAVANYLGQQGAKVLLIAEQSSWRALVGFGLHLASQRARVRQAIRFRKELSGVDYLTNCWPIAASGESRIESVTLRRGKKVWNVSCDLLAFGFHLVPNLELPELLGCDIRDGTVSVDEMQNTSVSKILAAGEITGIGGLELSLVEGEVAGCAAADRRDAAESLFSERAKQRKFATALNHAFALREELKTLAEPNTIVCRCEDVAFSRLQAHDSWRSAKLQTRCGMGPCQGRICGAAVEFIFNWHPESTRPPVFPSTVSGLAASEGNRV